MSPTLLQHARRIHLLGIGGIGVSAVARILLERGYEVSGSDVRQSALTDEMVQLGATVAIGHDAAHLEGVDLVVVSTAIPSHNVELAAAHAQGIPVVHRSLVLNALIASRRTVGVTGTHGKGTVSSMIAWILECAGWAPGFVIGGRLNNFGINARDGEEWMVVEVDESDGTHRNVELDYVVCNFLEPDHLNYYDDLDDIIQGMRRFLEQNTRLKEAFVNLDCKGNRQMVEHLNLRPTGYGMEHRSEWRAGLQGAGQLPLEFEAWWRDESLGAFVLNLPGRYNVVNAIAAIALTMRLGVPLEAIKEGLASYRGLENRFTIEQGGGILVVKDYNSHPTCMRKVLDSARDLVEGQIISVFKPYRYSLIKYLQDEYGKAFRGSDEVVITTMYAANEDPIPGVDTELVVEKIRADGLKVTHIPELSDIKPYLLERARPGDKVIFFGGDDFFEMADAFVAECAQRHARVEPIAQPGDLGGARDPNS